MKRAIVCCLFVLACNGDGGPADRSGNLPTEPTEIALPLRTLFEIETDLERDLFVFETGTRLELLSLLNAGGGSVGGIEPLLGTYEAGVNGVLERQPVTANPVNMFLWKLLMSRLAEQVAGVCVHDKPFLSIGTLSSESYLRIKDVCGWPRADAKLALLDLWEQVMGHRAPRSERTLWADYFGGRESLYYAEPAKVIVRDAVYAMLMNPYFLLAE